MEDVAPPQDPNPTYEKPAEENAPLDTPAAAATPADNDNVVATNMGEVAAASGMMNDNADMNTEEGGIPSGNGGNLYLRPVFLGNLSHGCMASDIENIFNNPAPSSGSMDGEVKMPVPLDRVDMKRGYAFVFLKDPESLAAKELAETYVAEINGMNINQVSNALRAEFARGDGRVKRKEDERRKKILPNETLFVVNFHEETTKREDLQMLFEPYGELVRIDMKRNYAFVQFKTIEEAIRAKEATNGGKLDQSEITVEFVARRMGEGGGGGRGDDRRGGGRRYDDRGGGGGRGGGYRGDRGGDSRPRRDDYRPRGGGGYRGDRYDDDYRRGGGGGGGGGGGYRGGDDRRRRSRSRSRSPGYRRQRSRSRSPGYDREYRSSRDEYRPSSRGGRDPHEDRPSERTERGYGRSEY
eukprot:CAMPEP_0172328858 /NCGR_PEP_ID=MMETSP1058-20130122/60570_1 /TAXON_ID=83371 /ORGANISM="Detonula confervacea, Strain CCMP 353" /LENGTH=410 /DNA_ID=CAMNT_0013045991 /DNA_START=1022 /DNA_END=2254 /DNA_ORIENTATION=+